MVDALPEEQRRRRRMPPCWCTLLTQASLCIALYGALNVGQPQQVPMKGDGSGSDMTWKGESLNAYFMSVGGGPRPLEQQAQLLLQMDNVARTYKPDFIVNLSELGDNDPLIRNATLRFPSLNVPWYATTVSKEEGTGYFLRQIKVPHDQTLAIMFLDSGLWQGSSPKDEQSCIGSDQLRWLSVTLSVTRSNWHIVVGFHSLADCKGLRTKEKINFYGHLRRIFLKYKVNAYLSNQGCGGHYTREGGTTYIRSPSHRGNSYGSHAVNGSLDVSREAGDGFHLHRVSPLEIESLFINSSGDVVSKSTVRQWGREDM